MQWQVYRYKKEKDGTMWCTSHRPKSSPSFAITVTDFVPKYMPSGHLIVKLVIIFQSPAVNLNCTGKAGSSEVPFGRRRFLSLGFALSLFVSWFGYGSYSSTVPSTQRLGKVDCWTLTPTPTPQLYWSGSLWMTKRTELLKKLEKLIVFKTQRLCASHEINWQWCD